MLRRTQILRLFSTPSTLVKITQLTPLSNLDEFALLCRNTFHTSYPMLFTGNDIDQMFKNFSTTLQQEIQSGEYIYLSASCNGKYIGYAKLKPTDSTDAHLEKLYVLKEFHHQGVGLQLMTTAIQTALQHDKTSLSLFVWEENKSAIDFYEKLGFNSTAKTKKDFGPQTINGHVMSIHNLESWMQNQKANNNLAKLKQ